MSSKAKADNSTLCEVGKKAAAATLAAAAATTTATGTAAAITTLGTAFYIKATSAGGSYLVYTNVTQMIDQA